MDFNKVEAEALANVENQLVDQQVTELNELQLVLVGGGGGEVVFA